jgi:hypothetical protein
MGVARQRPETLFDLGTPGGSCAGQVSCQPREYLFFWYS